MDVMGTQPSFLFPPHSSAGLPGHSVPAACLLVAREQLVCLYFFLDAGSAPAHHPLLVIAIGTRLHCPSAGFLFFFFLECVHRVRGGAAAVVGHGAAALVRAPRSPGPSACFYPGRAILFPLPPISCSVSSVPPLGVAGWLHIGVARRLLPGGRVMVAPCFARPCLYSFSCRPLVSSASAALSCQYFFQRKRTRL